MKNTKIKTIDIRALSYLDKTNANSYFSAKIIINYGCKDQRSYFIPFTYGYGEQYIYEAQNVIFQAEKINFNGPLWKYCKENKISLNTSIQENCKKSELINY